MDQFIAEIRIFPFTFAPTGWALCNGQLLPINQNHALFSLLGTMYGGDGRSTFALPNLQGSVPIHAGRGMGLSERRIGEAGGTDHVMLSASEMPEHAHAAMAQGGVGDANDPAGRLFARPFGGENLYRASGTEVPLAFEAMAPSGDSLPHNNLQPYLVFNFCIALQGIFPPRG